MFHEFIYEFGCTKVPDVQVLPTSSKKWKQEQAILGQSLDVVLLVREGQPRKVSVAEADSELVGSKATELAVWHCSGSASVQVSVTFPDLLKTVMIMPINLNPTLSQ